MNHYFKNDELSHDISEFEDTICGKFLKFTTNKGVFSKGHIDHLSKLFLEVIIDDIVPDRVLDFGCGYGLIGLCVNAYHQCNVDMLDINKRAIELSKLNMEKNKLNTNIFESNLFENVSNHYSAILVNPPIHAGKKICYEIYKQANNYLTDIGSLYIVISKKHGGKSTLSYLKTIYKNIEILYSKKGVFVVKSNNFDCK
ncbi:MAG: class I SAM-dependent methyltransferase [Bacilli bacterium]